MFLDFRRALQLSTPKLRYRRHKQFFLLLLSTKNMICYDSQVFLSDYFQNIYDMPEKSHVCIYIHVVYIYDMMYDFFGILKRFKVPSLHIPFCLPEIRANIRF